MFEKYSTFYGSRIKLFMVIGFAAVIGYFGLGVHSILNGRTEPAGAVLGSGTASGVVEPQQNIPAVSVVPPVLPETLQEPEPDYVDGLPMDDGGGYPFVEPVVVVATTVEEHAANLAVAAAWTDLAFTWSATDLVLDRIWEPGLFDTPCDKGVARANEAFGTASGMMSGTTDIIRNVSEGAVIAGLTVEFTIDDITVLDEVESGSGLVDVRVIVLLMNSPTGRDWPPLIVPLGFQITDGKVANAIVWGEITRELSAVPNA